MPALPLVLALAMAAASPEAASTAAQKPSPACVSDRSKYMALDFDAFDQDMGRGWREIADKPGCERAAADLIALYRDQKLAQQAAGLDFHEAQVRARAGETAEAVELFKRHLAFQRRFGLPPWSSLFTEAQIAFLEGDLAKLKATRAQLVAIPKPEGHDALAADFYRRFPQSKGAMDWPVNLHNLDDFLACFGRPYAEIGVACGAKLR